MGEENCYLKKMGKCADGVISGVEHLMGMLKKDMAKSMVGCVFWLTAKTCCASPHLYALSALRL